MDTFYQHKSMRIVGWEEIAKKGSIEEAVLRERAKFTGAPLVERDDEIVIFDITDDPNVAIKHTTPETCIVFTNVFFNFSILSSHQLIRIEPTYISKDAIIGFLNHLLTL